MATEPVKETFISGLLKVLAPEAMKLLAKQALKNLVGFKLWFLTIIVNKGLKQFAVWLGEVVFDIEQEAAQKKAEKEILNPVLNDPNHTPEQLGGALEDYYNSGRKPAKPSDNQRSTFNRM